MVCPMGLTLSSLLSTASHESFEPSPGGLVQVTSPSGGSKTRVALSCLGFDPPLPSQPQPAYGIFISDEGLFYPHPLAQYPSLLSQLLIVKTKESKEVWQTALEAIQTGLFSWILLRPSQTCHPHHLRKLQLGAERTRSWVLLLSDLSLPQWAFRRSYRGVFRLRTSSLSP